MPGTAIAPLENMSSRLCNHYCPARCIPTSSQLDRPDPEFAMRKFPNSVCKYKYGISDIAINHQS